MANDSLCRDCGVGEKVVFPSQKSSYCKDCLTARRLRDKRKFTYGLLHDDWLILLEEQGEVCAICGGTNDNGRALAVDHDHGTGEVRGLLCGQCNVALGMAQDNPEILREMAKYLESFAERSDASNMVVKNNG